MQKPLALAVIGGLGLSMLVTLLAVPSAYVVLRGRKRIQLTSPESNETLSEGIT
ncbi:MAG TPA: hypothetical protein VIA62_06560 [Thermoanaerobaculia bacterium]|jgi:Cu/Ag efflux pump CusA|nr:hypothetical protein [Thermoanaerobaculia bacterium]